MFDKMIGLNKNFSKILKIAKVVVTKLLSSKLRKYIYDKFFTWCKSKNVKTMTENVVRHFFEIMKEASKL